jgi:hypothetical protein
VAGLKHQTGRHTKTSQRQSSNQTLQLFPNPHASGPANRSTQASKRFTRCSPISGFVLQTRSLLLLSAIGPWRGFQARHQAKEAIGFPSLSAGAQCIRTHVSAVASPTEQVLVATALSWCITMGRTPLQPLPSRSQSCLLLLLLSSRRAR